MLPSHLNPPPSRGIQRERDRKNSLTFNPGWTGPGQAAEGDFTDVREIARRLEEAGLELTTRHLPGDSGPAHITLEDPDGNPILIDQHR